MPGIKNKKWLILGSLFLSSHLLLRGPVVVGVSMDKGKAHPTKDKYS